MKISVDYPDFEAEKSVLSLKSNHFDLKPIITQADLMALKEKVEMTYVDEKIKDMIIRIVHATRPGNKYFLKKYEGALVAGASPRASIWLYKIAKFKAFMDGKDYVSPEHILSIVPSVLGHRVIASYEAQIDKLNTKNLVASIAASVI
jgi:MoxR-like ATPase